MGSCVSTGNSRRGRDTDRAHGVLPDEVNRLLDKWAIGHVMIIRKKFRECKSSKSSELDLLGFRNFFTELDQGVPKSVVSAAFVQFDTRGVGRLSFRDICFGLATACISSWEIRSRFVFDMFADSDGYLRRDQLAELLRAVISAVRRSTALGGDRIFYDDKIISGFDAFRLDGLSPPSLERIQSCFTAVQSDANEGFTSLAPAPECHDFVLTETERQWMDEQIAHLVLSDQLISFSDFLPWSCRTCQYFFKFFQLFEIVPSPDREKKTCMQILIAAGTDPLPGSTWYVVSYKWMQLWKSYVRWNDSDNANTVWNLNSQERSFVGSPKISRAISFTSEQPPLNILHAVSTMDAMSCTSTVIQQRMAERPLAVNNADLEGELKGALKPNLIEHHDFLLVPEEMWNHLMEWYGGGPSFPRKSHSHRQSRRRLSSITSLMASYNPSAFLAPIELYPPLILVVLCGPQGAPVRHFTKRFFVSRGDSCEDLTTQLGRKMAGPDALCRLWHRRDGAEWEQLHRDDPRRIDDFGETSTGTFMLEVFDGVAWPRDSKNVPEESEPQVGDRVDAQGADSLWRPATIVDLTEQSVKVHFDGETYQMDAWINVEELAPLGSQTAPAKRGSLLKFFSKDCPAGSVGRVGLANIGNTCFMNSPLQCLAATPMLSEYFITGQFEKHVHVGAKMAVEFAGLLNEMMQKNTHVVPTGFKKALDKYAPLFAGYDHQDAHELLALLLDGLHEDLNRANPEKSDETKTDAPPEKLGEIAWAKHRATHSSVISDLFDGQQQISTQCRECGFRSALFESFRYIMLPVPVTEYRKFVIHLVSRPGSTNLRPKLVRLVVSVHKTGLVQNALDAVAATFPSDKILPNAILAEVYLSRIHRFIDITTPLSEFRSEDKLFAFQNDAEEEGQIFAQILHRRELVTKRQKRTMTKREVFGLPVVLGINSKWTHQQLFVAVRAHLARFVSVVAPRTPFSLRMVSPDGVSCSGCGKCEIGCLISSSSHRLVKFKGPWLYLAVDWGAPAYYDASMETVMITPKPVEEEKSESTEQPRDSARIRASGKPVRLYDCIDEYTAAEELVGENQWQCDNCKRKCDAERKITYTVAPDVLVILLKRFQFTSAGCEKINASIQFPLKDLVLRTSSPESYDLFGVVNHFGSLGAGHYTAMCKHTDWYMYNDHEVQRVQPSDIENCGKNCYVLFYKRNGIRPANIINYGEMDEKIEKPRKAQFRQRAHCNPLSDSLFAYPLSPDHVNWAEHYPVQFPSANLSRSHLAVNTSDHPVVYPETHVADEFNGATGPAPTILDIGCGFGGLLMHMSKIFPDKLSLGMEIREQVSNYVGERIRAARMEPTPLCENVSIIRTNSMKYLVNYIRKGQCDKLFFCFADPHFKKSNKRRRIVSDPLMSVYAYCLKPGGILYFITDVKDLFDWMEECSDKANTLFEKIPQEELEKDPVIPCMLNGTEEGMKVERNAQPAYYAAYRRRMQI